MTLSNVEALINNIFCSNIKSYRTQDALFVKYIMNKEGIEISNSKQYNLKDSNFAVIFSDINLEYDLYNIFTEQGLFSYYVLPSALLEEDAGGDRCRFIAAIYKLSTFLFKMLYKNSTFVADDCKNSSILATVFALSMCTKCVANFKLNELVYISNVEALVPHAYLFERYDWKELITEGVIFREMRKRYAASEN